MAESNVLAHESVHFRHDRATIAAGIALGAATTWNVSNVGAAADRLADAYGVSLALVGLLTTALFLTHLAAQLPSGRAIDRVGARRVGLAALAFVVAGNAVALTAAVYGAGLAGRTVTGLGSGAGFVAGLALVRAGGGGAFLQGLYGGGTMAGGGLAIAVVPQLDGLGWRAPYWSALALALACIPVLLLAGKTPPLGAQLGSVLLRDHRLLTLGALQAATFGLSVVAGNWVVTLLERQGHSAGVAGVAGSLTLFAGIVTRPGGGLVPRLEPSARRTVLAASLVAGAAGALLLALDLPLAFAIAGSGLLGLAAGVPFATIMTAAQRLRPDAPAAAIGVVNGVAVLTILIGTPLAGLAFSLPGDGRLAFAAIAALIAAALGPLARAPL